ncbi:tRNA (guanosine(18)-2'-O)-methyltransferase TrmH [Corallincola platygyrae]|uniref:tRNA (guanosine(18)-2'-O)-methyltransferase n=1 Tax=Corallincola platygyrae TaxID=1193278 RepID=A0ABW4XNX0_9GAMM
MEKTSRFARISALLDRRQTDLTVVMEEVHKPMNMAAIIRTCDAVGIPKVHAIWPDDEMYISGNTASGSQRWVDVEIHRSSESCYQTLKQQGFQLLVTHLSSDSVDFREIDYTQPTAIIMGHEKEGVSDSTLQLADKNITIPMLGAVQSLNVSAACAVLLYEAQRQRMAAGSYDNPEPIDPKIRHKKLFESCHPIFAKQCHQKGLPYPPLDQEGEIVADKAWWDRMRNLDKS